MWARIMTYPPKLISISRIVCVRFISERDIWVLGPVMGVPSVHNVFEDFRPIWKPFLREKTYCPNNPSYSSYGKSSAREPHQKYFVSFGVVVG
jgi:hypothetical protein